MIWNPFSGQEQMLHQQMEYDAAMRQQNGVDIVHDLLSNQTLSCTHNGTDVIEQLNFKTDIIPHWKGESIGTIYPGIIGSANPIPATRAQSRHIPMDVASQICLSEARNYGEAGRERWKEVSAALRQDGRPAPNSFQPIIGLGHYRDEPGTLFTGDWDDAGRGKFIPMSAHTLLTDFFPCEKGTIQQRCRCSKDDTVSSTVEYQIYTEPLVQRRGILSSFADRLYEIYHWQLRTTWGRLTGTQGILPQYEIITGKIGFDWENNKALLHHFPWLFKQAPPLNMNHDITEIEWALLPPNSLKNRCRLHATKMTPLMNANPAAWITTNITAKQSVATSFTQYVGSLTGSETRRSGSNSESTPNPDDFIEAVREICEVIDSSWQKPIKNPAEFENQPVKCYAGRNPKYFGSRRLLDLSRVMQEEFG